MTRKKLFLIIFTIFIVICLLSAAIGLNYFRTHSHKLTIEAEPAYLFTKLIKPDKMEKIENEEFV